MKNRAVQVLVALVGLAAVVFGIMQMSEGMHAMSGDGMPTAAEAKKLAASAAENLVAFASPSQGIALRYPKDWTTDEPKAGPLFFKCQTLAGVVNLNVMSEDLAPGTALAGYVELNRKNIEEALSKGNMAPHVLGQTDLQVGKEPAVQLLYSYTLPEQKQELEATQVFVIHGNRAFAFTFTTPKNLHESFGELVTKILASVQFS